MAYAINMEAGLKENYYALMLSIILGWAPEHSMSYMKVSNGTVRENVAPKIIRYKDIAEASAVLYISTGMSYRGIGRIFDVYPDTIKHAISHYRNSLQGENDETL